MNHRKFLLLWIVMVVGLTLSCRKTTAPYIQEPTIVWEKIYRHTDSGIGYSVQETSDGGFIIAGRCRSFETQDSNVYLVRTDSNGDTIWTKSYGGAEWDEGRSVCQTDDGGFVVVGYTFSYGNGNSDVYLLKTNGNGDTIWAKPIGGSEIDRCYSVDNTQDGNLIVAGYTRSFGAVGSDIYLLKVGQDGSIIWEKTIGGSSSKSANSIQQTQDQGFIMAGTFWPDSIAECLTYLLKTNENGDTVWTKTFGGIAGEAAVGLSICQASDGGYIISGYDRLGGLEQGKPYLLKTNASGDSIWARSYGEFGPSGGGYSVKATPHGEYVVAGFTWDAFDRYYAFAIKTDAIGDTIWALSYKGSGDDGDDKAYSVCLTSDGGYAITGSTCSQGAVMGEELFLIKIR